VTAFERSLRELIAHEGPISVERYMALCGRHYYATRDPFGAAGDFTTAPEISQMFGELIGLWCVAVWQQMGEPRAIRLVELGPGRGTLMADALRAARLVPAFREAASVHLVETSPALRERQRATLAGAAPRIAWHERLDEVPPGPALVVANEFFDALPVRQFMATEAGWRERLVGTDGDRLAFGLAPEPDASLAPATRPGEVREWPGAAIAIAERLAARLVRDGGAALAIDYGSAGPGTGDTLQAVRRHAFVDPLEDPGEADLTVQVDFGHLGRAALKEGALVHGPVPQAAFLEALGLGARAAALKRGADARQAEAIDAAAERLTARGRTQMGELFKVLGFSHPALAALPGLPGPST
jgi:NADH dehydrogenase [ubiquinone] 1 alpha subcomplex assembly factor 7